MKLVFLDFDGVLNSFDKHIDADVKHCDWNPETLTAFGISLEIHTEFVERVNRITDATGALIVVSSSWRIGYLADWADVVIHLHNCGLKGFIVGRTPRGEHLNTRGREIEAWFEEHPDEKVEAFIVLDDNDKMESLADNWILTDHTKGLQDEHVKRAIEILGRKE